MEKIDVISDSLTDRIAPTEADMAQRLQASDHTDSPYQTSNSVNSYSSALLEGYSTTSR